MTFVLKCSASKRPIKAYEILKELGKKIKNPKPPTAYRAIEFWCKFNFIHRLKAFALQHVIVNIFTVDINI